MKYIASFASIALLMLSSPALAQESVQPAAQQAVGAAEIDPAQLAAARTVVMRVFPEGTYGRIMDGAMKAAMGSMTDQMLDIPVKDLARIGGLSDKQLQEMGPGTLRQINEIIDPAFHQRMELLGGVMAREMTGIMTKLEPSVREGVIRAYAKRFSAAQLADLNRFFETPTGQIYGAESMLLFMDPEVMGRMQAVMPELMKEMPRIGEAIETATAGLPKPRTYEQLTKAERARLAGLLGVPLTTLEKKSAARKRR